MRGRAGMAGGLLVLYLSFIALTALARAEPASERAVKMSRSDVCHNAATLTADAVALRRCDALTVVAGMSICLHPGVHVVFALPEAAPDPAWLSGEAYAVLGELESATDVERRVGIAEYGSVVRRRLELTAEIELARRYLGDRATGVVALGVPEVVRASHEILKSGRAGFGGEPREVVVLFLTWKQLWLSRRDQTSRVIGALEDVLADGAEVVIACPGEGNDRCGGARGIATTLGVPYFDNGDRLKVAQLVRGELAMARSPSWESRLAVHIPDGLVYVADSALGAPDIRAERGGTRLSWQRNGTGSHVSEEMTFDVRGWEEGSHAMTSSLVVTTTDSVDVSAGAMTVTVHGSVCEGPTPTATPSRSSTPPITPVSGIPVIFLPIAVNELCNPATSYADTILVVDASTSMLDDVRVGFTKRDAAIVASGRFVDILKPIDQAGIVSFNTTAALEHELTRDRSALHSALRRISNRQFTRIDLGLSVAREELTSPRHMPTNRPVIILLTDGKANPEPVETAIEEAQLAKDAGAAIFVIGLGRAEDLDDAALRQIASRPDYYYQTPSAEDLAAIYEEIAGVIPCPQEQFWGGRP